MDIFLRKGVETIKKNLDYAPVEYANYLKDGYSPVSVTFARTKDGKLKRDKGGNLIEEIKPLSKEASAKQKDHFAKLAEQRAEKAEKAQTKKEAVAAVAGLQ